MTWCIAHVKRFAVCNTIQQHNMLEPYCDHPPESVRKSKGYSENAIVIIITAISYLKLAQL